MTWEKLITRRLAVQVAQAWNFAGQAMQKVYGVSIFSTLVFKDDKKTEYYVDEKEHKQYVAGLYKLLQNKKFLINFHRDAQKKLEEILNEVQQTLSSNLSNFSYEELLSVYQHFILPKVEQFYIRMWTVFNIAEPLTTVVLQRLQEIVKDRKKAEQYLLILSAAQEANDILQERIELLKLSVLFSKQGRINMKEVEKHTGKYQHIPLFDFDHEHYRKEYFLQELKGVNNPEKELNVIQVKLHHNKEERENLLKKLNLDNDTLLLITFLKENVFLRDYRDMIRQKLNLQLRRFYMEGGRRLGLTINQVALLTNEEIITSLENHKQFSQKIAKERENNFLLIQRGSSAEIYSGKKAVEKARGELHSEQKSDVSDIQGIVGSPGKVQGVVVIVYTNKDLFKVKKGNVLVATMTRQDFVPVMRKAAAIITDEGGVTCHAAIISRELGIPCIVGAKWATLQLKDGDYVEVDAEKGVVKLLKR